MQKMSYAINSGSIFGSVSTSSCSKNCLAQFKTEPRQLRFTLWRVVLLACGPRKS